MTLHSQFRCVCCKVMLVGKKRDCLKVTLGENVMNVDVSCNGMYCNHMMELFAGVVL